MIILITGAYSLARPLSQQTIKITIFKVKQSIMKYPCENCKLRAAYDKGGVRDVDNIVEGTIRSH